MLSAKTQFRSIYKSKKMEELPFEEDETLELFEECLEFDLVNDEITKLDLVSQQKIEEPVVEPSEDHLFILDWKEPSRPDKHLIKAFTLKNGYEAAFYFCNDEGKRYYRVVVRHNGSEDYLTLKHLHVDMLYMAYYL